MTRRPARARAYAPDPDAPGRCCDAPDCQDAGEYKAPKSRTNLNDYHWFCLAHVRAYNAGWDYYKGMSPGQIEAQLRADTSWQRPSWPLGSMGGGAFAEELLRDKLDGVAPPNTRRATRPPPGPPAELRESLATLGLDWPLTLADLKTRYKQLAKRHHPDANGGNRDAEERLKTINLAYAALRDRLNAEPRMAAASA